MGKDKHTAVFDAGAYREAVAGMRKRHENVHDEGERVLRETGRLHPDADIFGKTRVSHNSMLQEAGGFRLVNGIALPFANIFDGTASTHQYLEAFFYAAERQYLLLAGIRPRYNVQLMTAVVNDRYNVKTNGIPVVSGTQFETDERSAKQVRLLMPASMGNDTPTEDYPLALAFFMLGMDLDIPRYNLRGILTLTADEIGHEPVYAEDVQTYLGHRMDRNQMSTSSICQRLIDVWHLFFLQVPTHNGAMLAETTQWWRERMGADRVIRIYDPALLAEARAGLAYVLETLDPTAEGLAEFLNRGLDKPIDRDNIRTIWKWLQEVEGHFGDQARLPGYDQIPMPGALFANLRDTRPIDDPQSQSDSSLPASPPAAKPTIDWGKL